MKKACAILGLSVFLLLGLIPPAGCATFIFGANACSFMDHPATETAACDSPCCRTSQESSASNYLQCLLHEMPCCVKAPKDATSPVAVQAPAPESFFALPPPTALDLTPLPAESGAILEHLPVPTGPPPPILYLRHCALLL